MRIAKQRLKEMIKEEFKYGYSPEQALGYGTVSHKPSRTTEYTTADDEGKTAIVSRGKNPLTGETESGEKTHARDVTIGRDRYRALGKSAVKGEKPHPDTEWAITDAEERMDDLFGKSGRRESKQHLKSLVLQELEQMRLNEAPPDPKMALKGKAQSFLDDMKGAQAASAPVRQVGLPSGVPPVSPPAAGAAPAAGGTAPAAEEAPVSWENMTPGQRLLSRDQKTGLAPGLAREKESKQHLKSFVLKELEQMRLNEEPLPPMEFDDDLSIGEAVREEINALIIEKGEKWIQGAEKDIERRGTEGVCTGKKFGGPTCRSGTKRYNLAKTFRKMAKKRKK